MQSSHESSIGSELKTFNPVATFGVGLLVGAVIGFSGIVVLTLVGAGYYYRDTLLTLVQNASNQNNDFQANPVQTQCSNWGWNLLALSTSNKRHIVKKTE